MKKLTAFILLATLLITSVANGETSQAQTGEIDWEQLDRYKERVERLTETAYEVYGKATEEDDISQMGVFRTQGYYDYENIDIVIWYRTIQDKTLLPFEQLYFDLFQYEMLERFFADDEVNGLFFSYCWNSEKSGRYNKYFMGSITREAFESIDLELYDELFYFDYLEIKQADKRLFPQFYYGW